MPKTDSAATSSTAAGPGFVHLHVHSAYSLLRGAMKVQKLAELAKADRQPALALRGYAVVQDGPADMLAALDRHGYRADGAAVADAIRARWDPQGVLVR